MFTSVGIEDSHRVSASPYLPGLSAHSHMGPLDASRIGARMEAQFASRDADESARAPGGARQRAEVGMGKFIYENTIRADFDDRLLLHLQTVISSKLRRGEPFHFSWRNDASVGNGRTTVWIHPECSLTYKYSGKRQPSLNRAWLEALAYTANTSAGLHVVPEPAEQREHDGAEISDGQRQQVR